MPKITANAGSTKGRGAAEARASAQLSPSPPWQAKWQETLAIFYELRRACAGRAEDPVDADQLAELVFDFANGCFDVRDHLVGDPAVEVSDALIRNYVTASFPLMLIGDVTNIDKHASTRPDTLPARIERIERRPDGAIVVTVECERAGRHATVDALRLATKAIVEWRGFFRTHGLNEST